MEPPSEGQLHSDARHARGDYTCRMQVRSACQVAGARGVTGIENIEDLKIEL
jgi:hypothetical protein